MNAQHRHSRPGRGILAPVVLALGLALIPLAGTPPAQADQRTWSWPSQNWSHQKWSQNKWSHQWSKSQWRRHSDWGHQHRWKHHRPRFHDGFRHCFNCGPKFVFDGPRFKGGVFLSGPGFVLVHPGFVHKRPVFVTRQPRFIVRQPALVNQPVFIKHSPSVRPQVIASPPVPAIRIIRPGMDHPGVQFIRPGG